MNDNKTKVLLMRTCFSSGKSEVIEDYPTHLMYDAMRRAFHARDVLNKEHKVNELYWVKCVNC